MTQDICAAIEAAIAEDERVAKAATQGRWKLWGMEVCADTDGTLDLATSRSVATTRHEAGLYTFNASHIARHDPARVLRQAQAHRRILYLHSYDSARNECCHCPDGAAWPWPCHTVRAVAYAYGIEVGG